MKAACVVLLLLLLLVCGCARTVVAPAAPLPPAPPADVAAACALPEVAPDAFDALLDHRLRLVECRGAAIVNDVAWRALAGARTP